MTAVDINVLVRLLTGDEPAQETAARSVSPTFAASSFPSDCNTLDLLT
jgi:hypothetical protein